MYKIEISMFATPEQMMRRKEWTDIDIICCVLSFVLPLNNDRHAICVRVLLSIVFVNCIYQLYLSTVCVKELYVPATVCLAKWWTAHFR